MKKLHHENPGSLRAVVMWASALALMVSCMGGYAIFLLTR